MFSTFDLIVLRNSAPPALIDESVVNRDADVRTPHKFEFIGVVRKPLVASPRKIVATPGGTTTAIASHGYHSPAYW
ncbi:MAG: hypothetical protein R2688_09455 [Fimbriimonadaceae bacterium]